MKNILAAGNQEILAQAAWTHLLLAFDFDGSLAPIVANREDAVMRPRTRDLMHALCDLYPCAVISGRSRADVEARLDGANLKHIIGNHGLEPGAELGAFEQEMSEAHEELTRVLRGATGVDIEDKRYSLAVHYRRCRSKPAARKLIRDAVASLQRPMRLIPGKLVINVVPLRAPDKGEALLRLRALEQADVALYLGDDVTDEDVFKIHQPGRLLSIRVGQSQRSQAEYFVRAQRDVDALLARLVTLRSREQAAAGQ